VVEEKEEEEELPRILSNFEDSGSVMATVVPSTRVVSPPPR
jgi:hypothetical protein